MSLFDVNDNIIKVPFNRIFNIVDFSITSRRSSLALFLICNENTFSYISRDNPKFRDLLNASLKLTNELNKNDFQINTNDNIPLQIGVLLKTCTDISFDVDEQCVPFINNLNHIFHTAYTAYEIRRRMGVENFQHPENVGYIHIIFEHNIHWFYPIEYKVNS